MRTTYYVYTDTHPNDVSEHATLYSAHAAMRELVELGHEPVCERDSGSLVSILSWERVSQMVEGG